MNEEYVGHPDWMWYGWKALRRKFFGKVAVFWLVSLMTVIVALGVRTLWFGAENPQALYILVGGGLFILFLIVYFVWFYWRKDDFRISPKGLAHSQWKGFWFFGTRDPFFIPYSGIEAVDGDPLPGWAFFRGVGVIIVSGTGGKRHEIHGIRNFESVATFADVVMGRKEGDPETLLRKVKTPGGLMGLPIRVFQGVRKCFRWGRRKIRRQRVKPEHRRVVVLPAVQYRRVITTHPHICGVCGRSIPEDSIAIGPKPPARGWYHEECVNLQ